MVLDRVLLVDDDATSLYLAKRLLKGTVRGDILTAMNGTEAFRIVKGCLEEGQLPQLIISDAIMPVMDGMAFTDKLEELLAGAMERPKVVLLTEEVTLDIATWARQHPAVAVLEKPLTQQKVTSLLSESKLA